MTYRLIQFRKLFNPVPNTICNNETVPLRNDSCFTLSFMMRPKNLKSIYRENVRKKIYTKL